ncbi:hypothetical protein MBGDC06_00223 [Thermoplasmatales archaeon SCGC AB-539-C06]|nr:hypothetical protein MBGDC06_00223 [Thermoplasmatales archaeon SCGC AB-539-C06]
MKDEGEWIMVDDKDIINFLSKLSMPREHAITLMRTSENETKKKKKKKYRINIYGEEEEIEEQYDDYVYEILRYPPDSNPPTANNKQSLCCHFMVFDPNM